MLMERITLESAKNVGEIEILLRNQTKALEPYRVYLPKARKGKWQIKHINVKNDMELLRAVREGRGTAPGAHYTGLYHDDQGIVMSDTNAELIDMLRYLRVMSGTILVSGLGLGVAVKALLASPKVKKIVVVEKDKDVISLVGKYYQKDPRCEIVCADIWKWLPVHKFDWAWHDIWTDPSQDDVCHMRAIKQRFADYVKFRTKRQYCWSEDLFT
jgi:hypothetical protein